MATATRPQDMRYNLSNRNNFESWKGATNKNTISVITVAQPNSVFSNNRNIFERSIPFGHARENAVLTNEPSETNVAAQVPPRFPISRIQDQPGRVNTLTDEYEVEEFKQTNATITTYSNPGSNVNLKTPCDSQKRVRGASTVLDKNYNVSYKQYLQNKCKTYDQNSYNFVSPDSANIPGIDKIIPGAPDSYPVTYAGQCVPAVNGSPTNPPSTCSVVVYKPNNWQYAKHGAVSSSERIQRLKFNTINAGFK